MAFVNNTKWASNIKLTKQDRILLHELELNGRQPLSQLAKKLRMSKQSVHYRIQKFVDSGAILSFEAIINFSKLGFIDHEVWIQIGDVDSKKRREFEDFLIKHERVNWLITSGGTFDYAISILAENPVDFFSVFSQILNRYPGFVKSYHLTIGREIQSYPRFHLTSDTDQKRPQRALSEGAPKRHGCDPLDFAILDTLSTNGRISILSLAKKLKSAPNTIRKKMQRLEKEGVIAGYRAVIEPTKIGFQNYELLISVADPSLETEREFQTYCQSNPYIRFMLKLIGKWDLDIVFEAENNEHYYEILAEIRRRFGSRIREFQAVQVFKILKFHYFTMPRTI